MVPSRRGRRSCRENQFVNPGLDSKPQGALNFSRLFERNPVRSPDLNHSGLPVLAGVFCAGSSWEEACGSSFASLGSGLGPGGGGFSQKSLVRLRL